VNNDADTNNDALDRLRNRQRPTVPNRDATMTFQESRYLDTQKSGISTSRYFDKHTPRNFPEYRSQSMLDPFQPPAAATRSLMKDIQTSRYLQFQISKGYDTKQSTLRMEADLSDRLQTLCRSQGICREVLLEALYEHFELQS
jgi:hypothetical protein